MSDDIAKERADWLLDSIACATQDQRFLRGDPEYDEIIGETILLNGENAIRVAIKCASDDEITRLTTEIERLTTELDALRELLTNARALTQKRARGRKR